MKFDPSRPYGEVHGEDGRGARFYQDQHYFGCDGDYLYSNPGVAPPPGVKVKPERTEEATPPTPSNTGDDQPPASTEQTDGLTREQQLNQMTHLEIVKLVKLADGTPASGAGAKAKNVAWLLANTSE